MRFDGLLGNGNTNAGINGINWISGKSLTIESCTIFGFSQNGIKIAKTDGVTGATFTVWNTVLTNNGVAGLLTNNSAPVVTGVLGNSLSNNNQFGVATQDNSNLTITGSTLSGNGNTGVQVAQVTSGAPTASIFNSTLANNGIGLFIGAGTTANISGDGLFNNNVPIANTGTLNSRNNNTNTGTIVAPNNSINNQ
jgi:hypothetical protein